MTALAELSKLNPDKLDDAEVVELAKALLELDREQDRAQWQNLFPEDGPLRRELYPKHMDFFAGGSKFRERLFLAGNRVGKTVAGGYEVMLHLTGRYPDWWEGKRFSRPISAWVAGDTNETTRDIIQKQLLGDVSYYGTLKGFDGVGIIPYECIGRAKFKPNTGNLLDYVEIKHESGKWSRLGFKSYDQGRRVFQGTAIDVIWLDEECPMDVYGECLVRTATTNGILMLTFTPLLGMSDVVKSFLAPDTGATGRA